MIITIINNNYNNYDNNIFLLRLIVIEVSCFLTRSRGQPEDEENGGTYMRKRFVAMREWGDRHYDKGETNWEVNSRSPKSSSG